MNTSPQCTCPKAGELVHLALNGADTPACPVHRPDPSASAPAIALNDDAALAARLGAHLTKETH